MSTELILPKSNIDLLGPMGCSWLERESIRFKPDVHWLGHSKMLFLFSISFFYNFSFNASGHCLLGRVMFFC